MLSGCGGASSINVVTSPGATLSSSSLTFGNTMVGSTTTAQSVTLTNTGNGTLTITGVTVTGTGAADFAVSSNTCGSSLAASASCTVAVTFTPAAVGILTATVSIADNAAGSPQTVTLTGTGVAPGASLSLSSLTFASTAVGTSAAPQSVTLTNPGTGTLTITGITLTGTGAADFTVSANTCGSSLAPAGSCSFMVNFAPLAVGTFTATVSVADNATGSPQAVALTGTGVMSAASISPSSLTFALADLGTTSASQTITLTNSGTGPLTPLTIAVTGTNANEFAQTNNCGTTLAPTSTCSVTVTMSPVAVGTYSAAISFTDNATGSPQTVALSGSGGSPAVTVAPTSLTFANTDIGTTTASQTVVFTNSGTGPLNLTAVAITGTNASDFAQTNNCAAVLAPAATCSVVVTMTPVAAGSYAAAISFTDNVTGSPQTVPLTGSGGTPGATVSPTSLTFANTDVGTTTASQTITLSNPGSGPLKISGISITGTGAGDFAQTNNCPASLSPTATCSIVVTMTPLATGSYTAAVAIADNATGSPQTVSLAGSGGVPAATVTPGALTFANGDVGTTSASQTVTLTNSGSGPLNVTVTLSGANANNFAQTNNCGTSLAAGASCSILVTMTPVTTGSYVAAVAITDNASGSPQTVALTGSGGVPAISFVVGSSTITSLAFGTNVLQSQTSLSFALTNTGTGPLNVSSLTLGGSNPGYYSVNSSSCGSPIVVAAASSCNVAVTFTPTTGGASTATLSAADNVTGSPQSLSLSGTGAAEPNSCTTVNTTSPAQIPPTPNYAGTAFTGKVLSGATAVSGAKVTIYAAGLTGNGSAPKSMYSTTTSSTGAFTVPSSFTCPYSNSVLYAVASGGQVGTNAANAGIVLASVLGTCNSLTGSPSFTINEVTTAAMAWSMSQFLAAGGNLGSTSTNTSGIVLAAGTFANLVNAGAGSAPGIQFPGTGTAPTARINQLANLLNACTASSGAASSACTQLYTLTTTSTLTPSNTLDAALNLVRNPGSNVAGLYTLSTTSTAFTPGLAAAPADWTLFVTFSGGGMDDPSAVTIDSTGRVWVASYFYVASLFTNTGSPVFVGGVTGNNLYDSYGAGVDVNDVAWVANEQNINGLNGGLGTVTLLNSGGASPATYTTGGLNFPIAVAFDTSGVSWIVDYGNSHTTLMTNSGTPLSGPTGYTTSQYVFPVAIATGAKCNAYIADQSSNTITFTSADGTVYGSFPMGGGPSGIAVDTSNNIWTANYYGDSIGLLTSSGVILSGVNGFSGGGVDHPQGIAVDGAGTVWVANYRSPSGLNSSLSEFSGAGTSSPGMPLSPSTGWGQDAVLLEPFAVAIDASGNLWVSNFGTNTLTEFVGMAVPVKTPLLGPVRVP